MARKRTNKDLEYVVTRMGDAVSGDIAESREVARRAGPLRSDIWNKFGSLKSWGLKSDQLYKEFKESHPPSMYGLDFKQWQQTFNRVIEDIHACQASAKKAVIYKIYRMFKPEKDSNGDVIPETSFRDELVRSLRTLEWMDYPLLHRWMRSAYRRGHSWVDNQICVGIGNRNGATLKRVSRNIVAITFSGDKKEKGNRYEKLTLHFKVGRQTPTGNMQIIFDDVTGGCRLHFPRTLAREECSGNGSVGLDKGYTEAFTGCDGVAYGDGIGKVMTHATRNRHTRGKAKNKLWQIAQSPEKAHIHRCNLTKKRHNRLEARKRQTLKSMVRAGVNQVFDKYSTVITEDLSFVVKGKKQAKAVNRKLSEWCKKELQSALDEISYRRKSSVSVVNAAYTSQVDSRYGVLLGTRKGDQFFTFDGEVLQADCNAATTIKARKEDDGITRYMKSSEVRQVLIARTVSFLAERGLTLQDAINSGWFNPKHLRHQPASKAAAKSKVAVA